MCTVLCVESVCQFSVCVSVSDVSVYLFCVPGAKVHLAGSKVRCIEESGKNYTLEEGSGGVPEAIASCYQHTQEVSGGFTSVCVVQ